jgi:hypothetical protein
MGQRKTRASALEFRDEPLNWRSIEPRPPKSQVDSTCYRWGAVGLVAGSAYLLYGIFSATKACFHADFTTAAYASTLIPSGLFLLAIGRGAQRDARTPED